MKRIEDRVRVLIVEKGMTLLQLATQSKITEATLHAILNRNDAKYSQLKRMAETLNVKVAYLTGETDIPSMSVVQESEAGYVALKADDVIEMQKQIIELQSKLLMQNTPREN
ncbi:MULTISPECIES: helix-turn-helix transcriptional regulator [Arcicella]|uniref:Helix-turn-helix transcriptional regulator n=1 Tax=Arcicella aquatica TaxID=217141 RepID=A0ABU5QN55_9BACT|nr:MULTISPECIES: helix-turn-helix transcriptional regulator [Arcicella]MDR6560138.1 transcriptional regulator with XRE-family HTH domain [Arcicella sp. BE51]MDR6810255.1 transcriptional regulator with XRE-family HTH domain [Arcicella sp. BE140]MDR6821605.1 transcriptional regulator with XRE-family HTH domain [Arcicella sp. BE139]MEA5258269.1 helix-turn-helix transcriptional regulator [Arcicella aquatica]